MGTIVVSGLSKSYKRYPNRWARLAGWIVPGTRSRHEVTKVLSDVSFSVSPGEAVGIIGINGAGKSTLLKIITGTTQATTGSVHIDGRVAALLELGMGFHPDFTGRQNVYMAGQLLGYRSEEISGLMHEIEAFAEIGHYIDQPVRVYSSGMQMRLAFSVATAKRPDILIVDEALSVGDAYFQHKSFGRVRDFAAQGTTLLLVSHDKQAIQSICNRAILLSKGRVAMEGDPEAVMDYYNALLAEHQGQEVKQLEREDGKVQTISGTGEATAVEVLMLDSQGRSIEVVEVGTLVTLRVRVQVHQFLPRLVLGFGIKDRLGQVIFGTNTELTGQPCLDVAGGSELTFDVSFELNLGPGHYSVQTALVSSDTHLLNNFEWRDLALVFNVVNNTKTHFAGSTWLDAKIVIAELAS